MTSQVRIPEFIQYITQKPQIKNREKKSSFFTLAQKGILPKTGTKETVGENFDSYLYGK